MEIKGYKWITGKVVPRPWGTEYRYTVAKNDGSHINDIVMLENEKVDDETISKLIVDKLKSIDVVTIPETPIDQTAIAVAAKEDEIKTMLVSKGLLSTNQSIYDIKSKAELLKVGVV